MKITGIPSLPEAVEGTNVNKFELQVAKKIRFNPHNNNCVNNGLFHQACDCSKHCPSESATALVCPYAQSINSQCESMKFYPDTPERLPNNGSVSAQLEANLGEIKRALRNLMNKVTDKDRAAKRAGEWAVVALTIDRICFWIYLLVISVTALILLVPPRTSFSENEIVDNFDKRVAGIGFT